MGTTAIYQHPDRAGTFFAGVQTDGSATRKTLSLSEDAGGQWQAVEAPIFDTFEGHYENYVCFAACPNHPDQIYANLEGGAMVAVSTDGGQLGERMNREPASYFGYQSAIVFAPGRDHILLQGSESLLDDAWLGQYTIPSGYPVCLKAFRKIVGTDLWENRRPNDLRTFLHAGERVYVGQEGALSILEGETARFVFKSEDGNNFPYSHITAVWVDPRDTRHALWRETERWR